MPAETFVVPIALCYVFFFTLRHGAIWVALTMPCIVLLCDIFFLALNFLIEGKNLILLLRQASTVALAFLPMAIIALRY